MLRPLALELAQGGNRAQAYRVMEIAGDLVQPRMGAREGVTYLYGGQWRADLVQARELIAQYAPQKTDVLAAIDRVLDSQH